MTVKPNDPENLDLLDRLIAIRKWRGMTQNNVAESMYLARPLISMIETRRRPARLDFLEAYAKAIGAEIGVWPVPVPDPVEAKRPPTNGIRMAVIP
jgi:transcriptional regulator with XRE-family HTH domain